VGACVGARGARVRQVVNELRGEKIDIVPFSDDPFEFVAKALSPAKVKEVRINEETGVAEVIVPDYQLSLAIGKEGQNARLSARLTGWRVDIKSESQLAEEETYGQQDWAEGEWVVDAETGEQVWQPAEGGPALKAEDWEAAASEAPAEGEVSEAAGSEAAAAEAPAEGEVSEAAGSEAPAGGEVSEAAASEAPAGGEVAEAPAEDVEAELDAEEEVAEDVAELTETEEEAVSAAEAGEPADDESSER
jgi:transcription termination/antitermination protein NusA